MKAAPQLSLLAALSPVERLEEETTSLPTPHSDYWRLPRSAARRALIDTLKDGPCADCGGRFPPCAMEFDHVRGLKARAIGNLKYYRLARLMAEIEKCDLVCSNCHAIRTYTRLQAAFADVRSPKDFAPVKIDPNDTVTLTIPRGAAIAVGQTIRSLVRSPSSLPPFVDRPLFTLVGDALVDATRQPRSVT